MEALLDFLLTITGVRDLSESAGLNPASALR